MIKTFDWGSGKIIEVNVPNWSQWGSSLIKNFYEHQDKLTFSHKVNNRWENLYLNIDLVPEVRVPIRYARDLGKEKLSKSLCIIYEAIPGSRNPYAPFWFNHSHPGESTGIHDHEKDAAFSGVVYLECEKNSGNLFFRQEGMPDLDIMPEVGKMVLFEPWMRHGVKENLSQTSRLSLAFNLLPFPLPSDHLN